MNFAFTYIYSDIFDMGSILSYSIKKYHKNSKIIQISDQKTKKIELADFVERFNFNKSQFIFDSMKSKREISNKYGPTIFLDADMILLDSIEDFFSDDKFNFSITRRPLNQHDRIIKDTKIHREKFPELINKKLNVEMPVNAGIFFCKNIELMDYMISVFSVMTKNYYRWYGDQIALRELLKKYKKDIKIFDGDIFNYTPTSLIDNIDNKKVLHFKGGNRKLMLFEMAKKIYGDMKF